MLLCFISCFSLRFGFVLFLVENSSFFLLMLADTCSKVTFFNLLPCFDCYPNLPLVAIVSVSIPLHRRFLDFRLEDSMRAKWKYVLHCMESVSKGNGTYISSITLILSVVQILCISFLYCMISKICSLISLLEWETNRTCTE